MKKSLRITVNGKTYDVVAEVLEESPAPAAGQAPVRAAAASAAPVASAPAPAASAGGSGASGALGEVVSPLAGKVVSIATPVGTAVKNGQVVIVLEAMKMNTEVTANTDGVVKEVKVKPGDAAEEGQLLMVIE